MQIRALSINISLICPSPANFFSGKISRNLGYIPLVGTIIGIGHLIFACYQYSQSVPSWDSQRFVEEITRATIEMLSLGPVLLIYDRFFTKSVPEGLTALSLPFISINSLRFSDHAAHLVAFYATMLPTTEQRSRYHYYQSPGDHPWRYQTLFQGADFYTRHGIMHACFVAMFVPVFLSLYRNAGHPEALALSSEDVLGMQAVAFLHDYGRMSTGNDLCRDREELERLGQQAAYQYLKKAMGFNEERAKRLSDYILTKDASFAGKSLLQQLLQNCDSLAVLRADDWYFDPNHLDLQKWINSNVPEGSARQSAQEELYTVVDSAKQLLVYLGDSPFSMPCFSQIRRGQIIQGNFSLPLKRNYEKSLRCYELIQGHLLSNPFLARFASI